MCSFNGTLEEYTIHVNNKHKEKAATDNTKNKSADEERKDTGGSIKIPCDLCEYVAGSASIYIKHIESKHQTKDKDNSEEFFLACDKCGFTTKTEYAFKNHLERNHGLRVKTNTQQTSGNRESRLCVYWNRDGCSFGQKCTFVHKEIPACTFQGRCNRTECKFWHEPNTGKFPFLGQARFPHPPPFGGFARPGNYGSH